MVDIHCHILPGLDDGAKSLEIAQAMGEMAIADGITHIIGTPHANPNYRFSPRTIRERRDELQAIFAGRLVLATGCDFHLSFENLQDIQYDSARYTLNQKNYLLVEFADYSIPPSLDQSLHELQLAGLHPIVTHPERNPLIRAQPERLYKWLGQGCYVQITAQSLWGRFGKAAQEMAQQWLSAGAVHFIASDAHNITSRPLRLKETFDTSPLRTARKSLARCWWIILWPRSRAARCPTSPSSRRNSVPNDSEPQRQRRRKRFWFF